MQVNEGEVTMPVTVEQIAAAIHRMNETERNELLRLVPELAAGEKANEPITGQRTYNFNKARQLLQDVQGNLSSTVVAERDERG